MRWNAGGWFGGQIGATVWMLVAAVLTAIRDLSTGVVVLLLFVVPNIIGLMLWLSRKFSCYASTQILIGISGVCGLATVYMLGLDADANRRAGFCPVQLLGNRIGLWWSHAHVLLPLWSRWQWA